MEEQVVCPWCLTEIVWDEEIGPEQHCPHCSNELSAYRTIELGYDEDEVEEDEYEQAVQAARASDARKDARQGQESNEADEEDAEEEAYDDDDSDHKSWLKKGEGYRSADSARFAVEETVQRILDDQFEVPECPSCRSYMLEAGEQVINEPQFQPKISPSLGAPVLTTPFKINLYVCPSCYQTSTMLSHEDRTRLLERLTPNE